MLLGYKCIIMRNCIIIILYLASVGGPGNQTVVPITVTLCKFHLEEFRSDYVARVCE